MIRFTEQITTEEYMELRRKVGWMEFPAEEAAAWGRRKAFSTLNRVSFPHTPSSNRYTMEDSGEGLPEPYKYPDASRTRADRGKARFRRQQDRRSQACVFCGMVFRSYHLSGL